MDAICHSLSIQHLARLLQDANERGDQIAIAGLNRRIFDLAIAIQDTMKSARAGTYDSGG